MLRDNFRYKIAALGIAIVIWVYAGIGQNPRSSRQIKSVPLRIVKVEPGYVTVSAPQTVDVIVRGTRSGVNTIAAEPDSISAYVSLEGKILGKHTVPVRVKLPDGYQGLVSAVPVPKEVQVVLENKAQRIMAINVQYSGSPPLGYKFGVPQLSPGKAIVSGRTAVVNKVAKLVINVDADSSAPSDIDGDFVVHAIDAHGKQVRGVELTPERVHLKLNLLEAPATRAVFVSIDTNGLPPFPYKVESISIKPQMVTVAGKPERLVS
ncbi:MAG: hypothetical protein K6U00_15310, partial [Armatimonadetes bacterium]|nr:hypothetical protein [Armatimonadota bacterium]